jgi:hypothetical protein
MIEQLMASIISALEEARKKAPSREMSLVITKLEEAEMWLTASYRRSNVGSPNMDIDGKENK